MSSFREFAVSTAFGSGRLVVEVQGEVDLLTAPTLGAVLGALVDQRHLDVVLDLSRLQFMDASGVQTVADTAERLQAAGGTLSVRSAPALTLRLLAITAVDQVVHIEQADPAGAGLGPEQRSDDHSHSVPSERADLPRDLTQLGSIPASHEVIDGALRLVTALASATVEGADGVSVTLSRHGRLATVASSDDTILRMDQHQYETGEGPCLSAAADGHWFHSESLAEEDRWPEFTPLALEEGISSILSTPLMAADRPVGALNIYSGTERAFGTHQQELAALFATQASRILIDGGADVSDEQMQARIAGALLSRETIARAQGILMARESVTAEAAAALLHRSARTAEVTVIQQAAELVAPTHGDDDPDREARP